MNNELRKGKIYIYGQFRNLPSLNPINFLPSQQKQKSCLATMTYNFLEVLNF